MPPTTIKVDSVVRDRLARVAQARGMTMGALLDGESRRLEDAQRWQAIESAYRKLRVEDPDGWVAYLRELDEVTAGEVDASAATEWPEHNR